MEKEENLHRSSDHQVIDELQTTWDGQRLVKHGGFWCPEIFLRSTLSAQKHFKAKDSDIILASLPKAGTTWLKALAFSIANRRHVIVDQTPLLASNPHSLVPFLEEFDNVIIIPSTTPRILSTHVHFKALPDSIIGSPGSKIIYICRNPLDQFVSLHHFFLENKIEKDAVHHGLDAAFDMFCEGVIGYGPFWDHILGYWNAHLEDSRKVLFLKYEDLKKDIVENVKRIGEFMGCPFSSEEEKQGVVEEIVRLCSFGNLKNLEVNKSGYMLDGLLKNSSFFRKGQVGDWANYLSPAMAQRVEKLMEIKFQGSGLTFNTRN